MQLQSRSYWASRIDTENKNYFWSELQAGCLRQGWGYEQSQDLRIVTQTPCQDRSPKQNETYRQRFMAGGEGGWQNGDVILVPNVPTWGTFALSEVVGPYRFEIDPTYRDYGTSVRSAY